MNNFLNFLMIALVAVVLSSCGDDGTIDATTPDIDSSSSNGSNTNTDTTPPPDDPLIPLLSFGSSERVVITDSDMKMSIGTVFNSFAGAPAPLTCLSLGEPHVTSGQSSLRTDLQMNLEEVGRKIEANPRMKIEMGVWGTSAKAHFRKEYSKSSLSLASFNRFEVTTRTESANLELSTQLNEVGQDAYLRGVFKQVCGDAVVVEAKRGGEVYASIVVSFQNRADLSHFKGSGGFNVLGGLISGGSSNDENFKEEFWSRVKITISGLQRGGNPTKLGSVMGGAQQPGTLIASSTCRLGDNKADGVNSCADVWRRMNEYIATDFPSQLETSPALLSVVLTDYGPVGLAAELPVSLTTARQKLKRAIEDSSEQLALYRGMESGMYFRFSENDLTELQLGIANLELNIASIEATISSCYSANPSDVAERCQSAVNGMELLPVPTVQQPKAVRIVNKDFTDPDTPERNNEVSCSAPAGRAITGIGLSIDKDTFKHAKISVARITDGGELVPEGWLRCDSLGDDHTFQSEVSTEGLHNQVATGFSFFIDSKGEIDALRINVKDIDPYSLDLKDEGHVIQDGGGATWHANAELPHPYFLTGFSLDVWKGEITVVSLLGGKIITE